MFDKELRPLFEEYHVALKPLIAEYESRNEVFVTQLLTDLPFMFDHVALFSKTKDDGHKKKAECYLHKAIDEVRTCLVGSMMEDVEKFKSRFPVGVLMALDEGRFYGRFDALESKVRAVKEENLGETYVLLKDVEKMMDDSHNASLAISLMTDNRMIIVGKWVITILVALIVNWVILKLI